MYIYIYLYIYMGLTLCRSITTCASCITVRAAPARAGSPVPRAMVSVSGASTAATWSSSMTRRHCSSAEWAGDERSAATRAVSKAPAETPGIRQGLGVRSGRGEGSCSRRHYMASMFSCLSACFSSVFYM